MKNCDLCNILINEAYRVIYKDEHVFVALNFEPISKGHLMVMPIEHVENLSDLKGEASDMFLKIIDRAIETIEKYSGEKAICLVNGWGHRTQSHLHAHVLACKHGLRKLYASLEGGHHRVRSDDEKLNEIAMEIKEIF